MAEVLTIDCATCTGRALGACEGCVVSFLIDREPDDAVIIDAEEARALRALQRAGLVPNLLYERRSS